MTEEQTAALRRLRARWLGIYHVALVDGIWRAKRYGQVSVVMTSASPDGLAEKILDDYESSASVAEAK